MGKQKSKELSQAEIWDDSALLQSWDDALAEYKLYHSIHARGERVEDAIKDMEADGEHVATSGLASVGEATITEASGAVAEDLEDGELEEVPENTEPVHSKDPRTQAPFTSEAQRLYSHPKTNAIEQQQQAPGIPNALMKGVKDEALKNLMMSWYYAGYYTGFYEGQQVRTSAPK